MTRQATAAHPGASDLSAPGFVGRARELASLAAGLANGPAVVVVAGEAGIGKTRLVHEWLTTHDPQARRSLVTACPPFRQPYTLGPIVDAVRRATDSVHGLRLSALAGALRPLFPEWASDLPPAPEPIDDVTASRHRLFRAWHELLTKLDVSVLVVEDVHWADDASLEFLLFLTSQRPAPSLVVTCRPEDVPADSLLPRISSRLPAGTHHDRLTLTPLTVADTAALASSMLGGDAVSNAFAGFLHQHTDGVPLAVEESVRLLNHRGDVIHSDGEWIRRSLDDLQVPSLIRESVIERIRRCGVDTRRILDAAAVLAEPVTAATLTEVAELREEVASPAVEEALLSGLLTETDRNRVGFRHALTGRAVYDTIPPIQRRRLHLRAGETLEETSPLPIAALTRHFRDANAIDKWIHYAERAAELASDSSDDTMAVRVLNELLSETELAAAARGRLAARLATSAIVRTEAVDDLHRAVVRTLRNVLGDPGLDPRRRAEVRYGLGRLLVQLKEFEAGRAELEAAATQLDHDHAASAALMTYLAWPLASPWPAARHRRWLHRASPHIGRVRTPHQRISLAGLQAAAHLFLGDESGWDLAATVPTTAATARERREIAGACTNLGAAAIVWGRYGEARRRLALARELAATDECARMLTTILGMQAELDWLTGRWDGLLPRVVALAETPDDQTANLDPARVLGSLRAVGGDRGAAEEILGRALDHASRNDEFAAVVALSAVVARLRLVQHDAEGAVAVTDEPMRMLEHKEVWIWATDLAPVRTEALAAVGDLEAARRLPTSLARGLTDCRATAPRAALLMCDALVLQAQGEQARAAAELDRAAAAWDRLPRPYDAGLARERQGRCLLAGDETEPGLDLLREACGELSKLGARSDAARVAQQLRQHGVDVPRPWRGGRRGYGDRLSPRESEVVRLVVDGRTNRQIADLLSRSPKTISTQLNSAMRKLGVSSRTALAVTVVQAGLSLDAAEPSASE